MILVDVLVLIFAFYFLAIITNEYFLHSVDFIARRLKISSDASGATLLAAGSSAPELFIAVFAILLSGNHAVLGIGTIIGSALFNILIVIGITSIFNHSKLTWQSIVRDLLFYIFSISLLIASFWDGVIGFFEALQLVSTYIIYVYCVFHWELWFGYRFKDRLKPVAISKMVKGKDVFHFGIRLLRSVFPPKEQESHFLVTFFLSLSLIGVLSYVLIEAGVSISKELGVPEIFVALVILAIGTSIPDLLSSVFVSNEGRKDMAISNAVGSNVFNLLAGLGIPWLLLVSITGEPIQLHTQSGNLLTSMIVLMFSAILILGVMIFNKWRISGRTGVVLVFVYVMYILYVIGRATTS